MRMLQIEADRFQNKNVFFVESSTLNSPVDEQAGKKETEDDDDDTVIQVKQESDLSKLSVAPRWPTRVFAIDCLLKTMAACEGNRAHVDLALAKELNLQSQGTSSPKEKAHLVNQLNESICSVRTGSTF